MNLISEASFDSDGRVIESLPLVGKLNGLSYRPDFEAGFFEGYDMVLPKVNRFSCNYTVFHTQDLGFRDIQSGDADGTMVNKPGGAMADSEKAAANNRTNVFGGDPIGEVLEQAESAMAQINAAVGQKDIGSILEGNLPTGVRSDAGAFGRNKLPSLSRPGSALSNNTTFRSPSSLAELLSGFREE